MRIITSLEVRDITPPFRQVLTWYLGAVNPRDNDLKITDHGDHLIFDGQKHFNTSGVVSDLTVLEGVLEGTEDHIFAFVTTQQEGIQFAVSYSLSKSLSFAKTSTAQLEQRRSPPHRIRQRKNQPSESPLGQRPRLGHRIPQAEPGRACHPLRNLTPPHHPTRLLQLLSRNRSRLSEIRNQIYRDLDPRLAIRRRQQSVRHRRILHP